MTTVSARDEKELPNENVSVTTVNPFENTDVPTGDWIQHRFGWIEFCKSPEENVRRAKQYSNSIDLTVEINGERIENPNQYYVGHCLSQHLLGWRASV